MYEMKYSLLGVDLVGTAYVAAETEQQATKALLSKLESVAYVISVKKLDNMTVVFTTCE